MQETQMQNEKQKKKYETFRQQRNMMMLRSQISQLYLRNRMNCNFMTFAVSLLHG